MARTLGFTERANKALSFSVIWQTRGCASSDLLPLGRSATSRLQLRLPLGGRRQLRRTTVSRPSALAGTVRRGTGTGEASEETNAATSSWGTLVLKLAHHK